MEIKINDGKFNFILKYNPDQIINDVKRISLYKEESENYTEIYNTLPLSIEQYENFYQDFKHKVEEELNEDKIKDRIKNFPKKKNGSFNRKNIIEAAVCNIANYYTDYTNIWEYYSLQYKACSDTELELYIIEKTCSN